MGKTSKRNNKILALRIENLTLQEIGRKFDLSRQRIDQIVKRFGSQSLDRNKKLRAGELKVQKILFYGLKPEQLCKDGKERNLLKNYNRLGYKIFRNGWPDYLLVRNGEIKGLEIKNKGDVISAMQKVMKNIFEAHGIKYEIHFPE